MMVNLLLRINGSSLSIEKTGEELTNGTVNYNCYLIFEGNTTEWDNFLENRNAKAVFSTQVVDPINVPASTWELVFNYSENRIINPEYNIWESINDEEIGNIKYVYSCLIPASVIQAPGFSINLVGYEINAETQKYSKRLPTNIVYARVYPSVVDGTLEGLNPGVDWADLVPTAISNADEAKSTSNEAKDIATSALSEILNVREISLSPFTNTVTKSGLDAEKAVRSSGIFNFVEGTTHTQLKTNNTNITTNIPATITLGNSISMATGEVIFSAPPEDMNYPTNSGLTEGNREYFNYHLTNTAEAADKIIYDKLKNEEWLQFKASISENISPITSQRIGITLSRYYAPKYYYTVNGTGVSTVLNEVPLKFFHYDDYIFTVRDECSIHQTSKYIMLFGSQDELNTLTTKLTDPTQFSKVDYQRFDFNQDGIIDDKDYEILKHLTPGLSADDYAYVWTQGTTTNLWQQCKITRTNIIGGAEKNENYAQNQSDSSVIVASRCVIRGAMNIDENISSAPHTKSLDAETILDKQNLNIPNVNATNISVTNISATTFTVGDINTQTLSAGDISILQGSAIYFPKTNEDLDTSSMLVRNTDITDPFITLRGGLEIVDLAGHHATIKISSETFSGAPANCLTITDLPGKSSSFSGIFKVCGQIVATHEITAQSNLIVNGCRFHTAVSNEVTHFGLESLPAGGFHINGDVYAANFYQGSLYTLKENIRPLTSSLSSILKSDLCSFNYKKDYNKTVNYGLIIGGGYNTPLEILSGDKERINLYSMTAFAWRAIQELNDKIVALETKVSQLESQLNS